LLSSASDLKTKVEALQQEGQLETEVNDMIAELERNSAEFAHQREELMRQLKELDEGKKLSEEEISRLQSLINEFQNKQNQLTNDKKRIKEELDKLKEANSKRKIELTFSQEAAEEISKDIRKVRSEADQAREDCLRKAKEAAEKKLAMTEEELIAARDEINRLKNITPPKKISKQQKNEEKFQELPTKNSAVTAPGEPKKESHKNCKLYKAEKEDLEKKNKTLEAQVKELKNQKTGKTIWETSLEGLTKTEKNY